MKRIEQIISGVTEKVENAYKQKKVYKALEIEKMKAEEDRDLAQEKLDEFPVTASKDLCPEAIVSNLNTLFEEKELAEAKIARLDNIKAYLDTEVKEK